MVDVLQLLMDRIETPIGELLLFADIDGHLHAASWTEYESSVLRQLRMHYGEHGFRVELARKPHDLADAMGRYFAGDLAAIDRIPVEPAGTAFQRQVWLELSRIPCGTTISYAELAKRIGRPNAVRAVGLANGSNPVPIVVPCHRVIGSNGSLTGYGGGIERKRWLLEHEKCNVGAAQRNLYGELENRPPAAGHL